MHVISCKCLLDAAALHGELAGSLDAWRRVAKRASWNSLAELRQTFPSADAVGKYTVFNIKGNQFRLIAEINYGSGSIFLRHVLTHAEYDKGGWKK
jgi:mRNA interferase HigB